MFGPGRYTESETLVGFLDTQLASLRASTHGLTEAQARATPCRSGLSIGGLLKHTTYVLRGSAAVSDDGSTDEAGIAAFTDSFTLRDDETLADTLADFDAMRAAYLEQVRAYEPGAEMTAPPAPWDGIDHPTPSVRRFSLVHHVEELARHAGHADVIREEVDGASAPSLLMAVQGREGNAFVQPWARVG